MTVIPATIPEPERTTRRLGELLGLPTAGSREPWERPEREARPLPLVAVKVRARIVADCAVTELEERFANASTQPMDVAHTIPLPADGAVVAFEISAGGRVARGRCKRTEEARADFADAARRGRTAAFLDSVRDDVHVVNLANVPPKSEVVVRLTIVERLRVDDGRFEYRFPTTISPKFVPGDPTGHDGQGTSPDTDRAPDASRLTPPVRLDGGTLLDLEIALPDHVTDLGASMPLVRSAASGGTVVLRPESTARCSRDVVVRAWSRTADPVVRAYTDGERTLVVVDPPARRKPELECPREAVFVLDRSGSMGGPRIEAAKRALLAALRGLSPRDTFEILAFDTAIDCFAAEPTTATPKDLERAAAWLAAIDARGGTEALPALEMACARRVAPGRLRTVLFLTDGDVGNDLEILALVRQFDPGVRLFTVGIGLGPSAALLGRLARTGGGATLSVEDSQDVEAEIRRFESALAGPMACGLGASDARRSSGRDLFAGRSTTFFLEGSRETVEVTSIDGRFTGSARVAASPIALGALWARDRVTELEDRLVADPSQRGLVDAEIADLGVRHQVQTRLTSFVAIDEESQVHGEPVAVVQPTDAPADRRHEVMLMSASPPAMRRSHVELACSSHAPLPSAADVDPRSVAVESPEEILRALRAAADRIVAGLVGERLSFRAALAILLASILDPASCDADRKREARRLVENRISRPPARGRDGNPDEAAELAAFLAAIDQGDALEAVTQATSIAREPTARGLLRFLLGT